MMSITTILIIGDILVCGFLAGLVAWLLTRADKQKMDEAARIPLEEDEAERRVKGRVNDD